MIRVLVVDDSAVMRHVLAGELARHADIEVVGTASDPYEAREAIVRLRPDVLTLDVAMPRMDGLSFLEKLMQHHPIPTVVVSAFSGPGRGRETARRALELGAAEVVAKPASVRERAALADALAHAVRAAAGNAVHASGTGEPARAVAPAAGPVLAIGASTGGTRAIESVLAALPADAPGTVIVQHMPRHFTASFAQRLRDACPLDVREARDGDRVTAGLALVAPGDRHLVLHRAGTSYVVRLSDGPLVHHQRPAVDVLFESVARHAGANAVGVLLTGMGADGARGLLAMREAGAHTLAQDEQSCVVFGMPKAAIQLGAACEVLPLDAIAAAVLRAASASR
ncbi:Chemotaxis response regulator protein-glutamate methylesterase [Gemmatirosa kalamazoonensis]|uniref:Protein-glutamate methylesterase/protein-glutamine glutaminase n=1 Tax=Gemmatirosa kalamazoonensis TaxID=861299 RepID=W0RA90_9BACT|nr:chemotaxis response regulator protein-glutamate methylesterase [Gemmatirosa kalamazoonensis]AHG87691.1 Chemotaxis response regulator protein-glutamate methylesterase [Gemmatirosa kalamazoonensis]